jgi:serine/threonine protein kinase
MDRMLYAFAESVLGRIDDVEPIARGTTARLWRVDTGLGRFVVKQHGRGRAFAQERAALAAVADENGPWPRAIASDDDRLAVVMTWLPGRSGDAPTIDGSGRAAMLTAAGALRRRLDDVTIADDDPVPLADALALRMATALEHAATWCAADTLSQVRAAWRADVFEGATRRFCHRDFAPHNWLVADDGACSLVDFGHARADHPLVDLARALSPVWGLPSLRDELFAGYGRTIARDELDQLELLDAVATAAWARRRADDGLAARGDAALARWLATRR